MYIGEVVDEEGTVVGSIIDESGVGEGVSGGVGGSWRQRCGGPARGIEVVEGGAAWSPAMSPRVHSSRAEVSGMVTHPWPCPTVEVVEGGGGDGGNEGDSVEVQRGSMLVVMSSVSLMVAAVSVLVIMAAVSMMVVGGWWLVEGAAVDSLEAVLKVA